jgi:hypothetical protein
LSSARRSYELALGNVSDKVPELGGAMANKRTPKKRATKKRASKAPGKKAVTKATKKRASKAPAKKRASKASVKKRTTRAPAKSSRPTKPAKPRAKRAAAAAAAAAVPASAPVSAPAFGSAPPPEAGASSRPASYLEGVPHDHAELVSGLFQVVRGAAKDLKTLVTQAIAISSQKNDPFG